MTNYWNGGTTFNCQFSSLSTSSAIFSTHCLHQLHAKIVLWPSRENRTLKISHLNWTRSSLLSQCPLSIPRCRYVQKETESYSIFCIPDFKIQKNKWILSFQRFTHLTQFDFAIYIYKKYIYVAILVPSLKLYQTKMFCLVCDYD